MNQITLDDSAIVKIKELLADEDAKGLKLRIYVSGGGCSGFQYGFTFDDNQNTLTIYNVALDYGTTGVNSDNFEIIVYGLNIPGNYKIEEIGNDVVITLNDRYIDFNNVTLNDIYVIGKLVDVPVVTEDNFNITTEDGLDIII
jgi:Fe-S cluster assembly iron-binding protein IscA